MPQFIFTYYEGTNPATPEEGKAMMEKWLTWEASLGKALMQPGAPVGITKVITKEGVSSEPSSHPMMGYSILQAESLEVALELLKNCPHFEYGGTLEVSEIRALPSM